MSTKGNRCFIHLIVTIYLWTITLASDPVGSAIREDIIAISNLPIETPLKVVCPDPEDIKPCECYSYITNYLDIDCSYVQSEEELKRVFSQEFPNTNFSTLTIYKNRYLDSLKAGDFGNASFITIDLTYNNFVEIEDLTFIGSQDTLYELDLTGNKLQYIPDISPFKILIGLYADINNLTMFPTLNSMSLQSLSLKQNQIKSVPLEAIYGLPFLMRASLFGNSISRILPGTFSNNTYLNDLHLGSNELTTLPLDAIALHGQNTWLYIGSNDISHLPPGSFSGVTQELYMNFNSLDHLDEEVWRPLLEDEVEVNLLYNPFGCDCDIAWLILNQTLLGRVDDETTCADRTPFVDLDPAYYEEMC